ncbi:hypothetical protein [Novosphingobium sp. PC22D]|uniref:hypothetical protein n=1 Tax=Novosphingobium sp. PC22D TaxID=1962403 RepID=UPI00143A8A8E|nr:hypothetical protein [Novosphingobium sp. PC22D]
MNDCTETGSVAASDRPRAVWSTPKVIESRLSDSQANVTVFTDGTSPTSGISYGS